MPAFKPKEVISILGKVGFTRKRQTGSHVIMYSYKSGRTISVPMHTKDIGKGLLKSIIKHADSSEEEFLKLK